MLSQEQQAIRDLHRQAITKIEYKTGALHRRRNGFEKNKETKLSPDLEKYFEKGIEGDIGRIKDFHKESENYPYIEQEFKSELEQKIKYFEELFNQFEVEFKRFNENKDAHSLNSQKVSLPSVNKLSDLHQPGNSALSDFSESGAPGPNFPSKKRFLERATYNTQQEQNSFVSDLPQINSLPPKKRFRHIKQPVDSASDSPQARASSEGKSQEDQKKRWLKRI